MSSQSLYKYPHKTNHETRITPGNTYPPMRSMVVVQLTVTLTLM